MADQKISQLTDGTSFQAGDEAVVNRSGTNYKVDPTQFGSSIDVTGTVTADGYTFDLEGQGITFITTSSPRPTIKSGDTVFTNGLELDSDNGLLLTYDKNDNLVGGVSIKRGSALKSVFLADQNGDISFYEDTGTTPKFFWDASAESLGIGTSSPGNTLEIIGPSSTGASSTGNALLIDGPSSTNGMKFFVDDSANACGVQTRSLDDFLINPAGGNVGIGTSSPSGKLHISGTGTTYFFADGTQTSDGEIFDLVVRNGTDSVTSIKSIRTGANDAAALTFSTQLNAGGGINERMRIDSSGNLLVGKTALSVTTEGFEVRPDGTLAVNRDGANPAYFGRLTDDGDIVQFRKDGTSVGSIGSESGVRSYIVLDPRTSGAGITAAGSKIQPTNQTGSPTDATIDIGEGSYRWKNLYLSGGIYLGGTGAANLLDDYEEGDWTPTYAGGGLAGITYGTQTGKYTKVGNMVTVWFRIATSGTFTATSGAITVSGLPFTASSTLARGALSLHDSTRWTSNPPVTGRVTQSTAVVNLISDFDKTGGGTDPTTTDSTDMLSASGTNNTLEGSLTYFVA